MTPDTVHLAAQVIRHQRALATSLEKWVQKQAPSETTRELGQLIEMFRGVLKSYESQLERVAVQADR